MAVLLGSEGGSPFPTMFFQQSITWACPVVMDVLVYVIGGGGGGAGDTVTDSSANGGGAGGCAVSRLTLAVQDYTLTIGAGGAGIYTGNAGDGAAGGNTSMAGTGMTTMTGNGGGAGTNSSNVAVAGGAASGGTLQNNTGGGSPAQSDVDYGCSGGGGVGLYGPGQDGVANTTNEGLASGGSPIGITPQQTGQHTSANTKTAMGLVGSSKENGPIGVDIFPGLSRPLGLPVSDLRFWMLSDMKTTGAGVTAQNVYPLIASSIHCYPAGPFCGGDGYAAAVSQPKYAAGGTAGGGGGGIANRGVSSYVYGGDFIPDFLAVS